MKGKLGEYVEAAGSLLFGVIVGYMAIMVARQSVTAFVALIVGTLGGTSFLSYFKAGVNPGWFGIGLFVGFVTNQIIGYILLGNVILYDPLGIRAKVPPQ